jgi:hypothetical protein
MFRLGIVYGQQMDSTMQHRDPPNGLHPDLARGIDRAWRELAHGLPLDAGFAAPQIVSFARDGQLFAEAQPQRGGKKRAKRA